jgi:serine/threonine protein kinase
LVGKYQLFASLGKGGMADVYLAVARGPLGFNKLAVVKRLRVHLSEDSAMVAMFLDEARLAARLNNPNVVHMYEVGEHDGMYFIAMEYLEGQPLNRILSRALAMEETLAVDVCLRIACQALSGLHYAHELKDYDGRPIELVHRDISPHNVFVTYDGQVKLVDFGIAKAALSRTHTEVGVLKGKVAYMSPEQARGEAVDRRSDLFSMGVVLWEMLTLSRMFAGESAGATLHKVLVAPIPRLSEKISDIDPRLDDVLAKALQRDPAERFQTAQEMRRALEACIDSAGLSVRQEELGQLVSDMFEDVRADVNRQVREHMAAAAAEPAGSLPSLQPVERPSSVEPLPAIGFDSDPGASDITTKKPRRVFKRRAIAILVGVFLLTGSAVLARLVLRQRVGRAPQAAADDRAKSSPPVQVAPVSDPPPSVTANVPSLIGVKAPTAASPVASSAPPSPLVVQEGKPPPVARRAQPVEGRSTPPPPRVASVADAGAGVAAGSTVPGYLSLDTYPWTHVSEGGHALGDTPLLRVPLPPGAHLLELDNPELGVHQTYSVTIRSGEGVNQRLGL